MLENDGRRLLVDTPPEVRLQLLRAGVGQVDAVWYTHCHADHTHGIDDLRVFSMRRESALPVYGSEGCIRQLRSKFDYVFNQLMQPLEGTTKPEGDLRILEPFQEVEIAGFPMTPLPVPHGTLQALGFRIGDLGYITDAKLLPDETVEALDGVRTLVLNALWFGLEHPTHFNIEQAIEVSRAIGAQRTYLTHLTHLATHGELLARLPEGIEPAYDGLTIEF